MSNFIDEIKDKTRLRVDNIHLSSNLNINTLDFCRIFADSIKPAIIAEIKFASPSQGRIYQGELDHIAIAKEYLISGASALSILTEPDFFKGNVEYIQDVRKSFPQSHILLKDFVLSRAQITQGLEHGANAILLIVAFLEESLLMELYKYAIALGLTPILEVHDLQELEIALKLDPKVIGINNRNLKTLEIDSSLDTSRTLIKHIPKHIYAICESGIESKAQLQEMYAHGFDGFLIGSRLMKNESPGKVLRQMLSGGNYAR